MPGTVAYLNHEPVWLLSGPDIDTLVVLGFLNEGDVNVTITTEHVDQLSHQTGISILEKYHKGSTITVEAELAEVLNLDMWGIMFPTGEEQMDDTTPPFNRMAGNKAAVTTPYIGQRGTSIDTCICLRPQRLYVDATTETGGDLVIPRAVAMPGGPIVHGIDSAQVLPLEIHGLYDTAATQGENLWYYGISAGTWVVVA